MLLVLMYPEIREANLKNGANLASVNKRVPDPDRAKALKGVRHPFFR